MRYKNTEVDGNDVGTWDGIIYIIWGDKGKTVYVTAMGDVSDKFFSLNDCLEVIGYNGEGSVLVVVEDYTDGKVFRYNNYSDKAWREVGTTCGFA